MFGLKGFESGERFVWENFRVNFRFFIAKSVKR